MIKLYRPGAEQAEIMGPMTFGNMQAAVGGYVECVHIKDGGVPAQVICNEYGLSLGLSYNALATMRFQGQINLSRQCAVGVYLLLTGKDMLK